MTGSIYRIPLLNRKTSFLLFVGFILLGTGFHFRHKLYWDVQFDLIGDIEASFFFNRLTVGIVTGSLVGCCWIATCVKRQWLRFSLQSGLVLLFTFVLSDIVLDKPWQLLFVNFIGLILSQNLLFAWTKIPHFNQDRNASLRWKRQFSIGNLVMLTTAFALLLALTRWFETPVAPDLYWTVLIGTWILLPLLASFTIKAILDESFASAIWRFTTAVVLIIAGAVGLGFAEQLASRNPDENSFRIFVSFYLAILLGYAVAIAAIGIVGRLGGQHDVATAKTSRRPPPERRL